jgi:tetratricopeptide (TPR) repeat protein
MKHSRHLAALAFLACLLVASCSLIGYAQTPASNAPSIIISDDIKQALITLNAGDAKKAIAALKQITKARPNDGDAWHYLGLAYKQKNDRSSARKAFKRAADIRSDAAFNLLYVPVKGGQEETRENLDARSKKIQEMFEAATKSIEQLISVDSKAAEELTARFNRYRALAQDYRSGRRVAESVYASEDLDERVVVTSKPEPLYTETARNNNIKGNIKVRLIFAADGTVQFPVIQNGLGYGLDEQAIRAALAIKFQPGRKNGRAVSTAAQVIYGFMIY